MLQFSSEIEIKSNVYDKNKNIMNNKLNNI